MLTSNKNLLVAFFNVLIFSFALNTLNVSCIKSKSKKENEFLSKDLVYNQTIFSIDNSWYLPQIKNYLNGNGFTCDTSDKKLAVRRTPVYPLFYGMHYILFGEKNSFFAIKITQTILFALSAIAFLLAVFYLTNNKNLAWIAFAFYGFNPTLISYTYYTITESLSPALVCFMLYFLAKSIAFNQYKNWFFTGIFFSIGALCRPTIFIFGASVAFVIIYINRQNVAKLISSAFVFGCAVCLVFVPYIIRNYKVSNGDFILLEKYYGDPMNYGMQNIELRKWISSCMNPADYTSERISNKMISEVLHNGSKNKLIDSLVATVPIELSNNYNEKIRHDIFTVLYNHYAYKFSAGAIKNIDSSEALTIGVIQTHTHYFIAQNPIRYYFITPVLFIKSFVLQSNSGTISYLDNFTTNKLAYVVKFLLILLNVFLFFSIIGNLIFIRKYFLSYGMIFLFVAINCIYIIFILKYFECRYLIPLFPLLYISGAIFATEMYTQLKQRLNL